ncbi:MAG: DUF3037 domain-containing protein [Bacilli bacterium]|nr:DUF3037 domain-containing protein [Bacilli bacterium]
MGKFKAKYAVLKYVPNLERNERINIAIVLHYPESKQLDMIIINNWKRVRSFDDEADIPFLKKYVDDLKEQFTINLLSDFDGISLDNILLLDELTKYFVNKFIFEIHEINTEDSFKDLLDNLKNIYLYYDISKEKRVNEMESKAFIEKHFLENNVFYERCGHKNAIQEKYGNNINFDYKIDDKYYKLIFLTEDNYNGYVAILKMWITNSIMLKKENKELIFVLDDNLNNEKTNSYKRMLSEYGKIISIQDFVNIKIDNNK